MRVSGNSVSRPWGALVNRAAAGPFLSIEARRRLYRVGGLDLNGSMVRPERWFFGPDVEIGEGAMVNRGCVLENRELTTLGRHVSPGPEVLVLTSTHHMGPSEQRCGEYDGAPVVIGDGAWIGARTVVLPGVTVGSGVVVGTGSVVTGDVVPDTVYVQSSGWSICDLPPSVASIGGRGRGQAS